jgi:hypothetical protein
MNVITLDFETYYDQDFTLSKLTTEEYVRDARFEVHGCAIAPDGTVPLWWTGSELKAFLNDIDWSNTACLCHHAQFDGLILSHVYGIKPKFWLDTLSMGRLLLGTHLSVSLASLAQHFNLAPKTVPYDLFRGRHWHELSPNVQQMVADGACHDVQITWDLFQRLSQTFPVEEYRLVDATVRMFTNPVLAGDTELLGEIWRDEETHKAALLEELGVSGADLRKQWRFAELLRAEGIEPEQKLGKPDANGEERWNYSFAKTDDFMRELLEHEDERVAMLAQAKLEAHSNGVQTRTNRLGWMSTRGPLCVYLNYCGAHTTRWSGGDKVNWQNFKRGGRIGKAIRAPQGHLCVVNDASQIECRLLNYVAGQEDVVDRFRAHEDPYVALATAFYRETVYKAKTGDPRAAEMEAKRGTGKQGELSCGYGAGGPTIQATAKKGTYGPPVILSAEEAIRLRDTYRQTHPHVVRLWDTAGDVLKKMNAGLSFEWEMLEVRDKRIYLPNGSMLHYETLAWHEDEEDKGQRGWRVQTRRHGWSKMYGAKLVENIIQALARLHVAQAWLRCQDAGLDMVSMEHDKLIAVVRTHESEAALDFMRQEMSRPPPWLPGVPLDSEGYISETFAKPE